MIIYSPMIVREAIDKALAQVSQYQTGINLDYKTVWRFLNNARREMYARVIPFKDFAFIRSISISNNTALPADFTKIVRVMLRSPGGQLIEARRAAPKEWWRVTNIARPHTVDQASQGSPVYTLWGARNTPTEDRVIFYCSPASMTGVLEYYASYGDLPLDVNGDPVDTATLNVPYEFENLIISSVLERIYAKIGEKELLARTFKDVQSEIVRLRKVFTAQKTTEGINLNSLVDPEPSRTPSTTIQQQ